MQTDTREFASPMQYANRCIPICNGNGPCVTMCQLLTGTESSQGNTSTASLQMKGGRDGYAIGAPLAYQSLNLNSDK